MLEHFDGDGKIEEGLSEETRSIDGVEIFVAGEHGEKGNFSLSFLDATIANYDPSVHEAPITLDHIQSGPAYGWVKRIWRKGTSLFADLGGIPQSMFEAIANGRYKKRSVEIYRNFDHKGPMLRALTFLGSKIPQVKGMEDVRMAQFDLAAFDEKGGDIVRIEFDAEPIKFSQPPEPESDPFPGKHGIIERNEHVETTLGHHHTAFVDEEMNGFTTPGERFDEDFRAEPIASGHVHEIIEGVIQPSESSGISHKHPSLLNIFFSESKSKSGGSIMPEVKKEDKVEKNDGVSAEVKFSELEASNEKLTTDLGAANEKIAEQGKQLATIQAERFDEQEEIRFNEAFGDALKGGRITPAEKDELLAIFNALPSDPVEMKEGDSEGPRTKLLKSFAKRDVVLKMSTLTSAKRSMDLAASGGTQEQIDERRKDKVAEIMTREKWSKDDPAQHKKAVLMAEKEIVGT